MSLKTIALALSLRHLLNKNVLGISEQISGHSFSASRAEGEAGSISCCFFLKSF